MGSPFWERYWWTSGTARSRRKHEALREAIDEDIAVAIYPKSSLTITVLALMDARDSFRAAWTPLFDNTYRVMVNLDTGKAEVVCLGIDRVDSGCEGIYNSTNELPEWMQQKLAVLAMIEVNPPQTEVEGVGIRIDHNTYWILEG